MREAVWTRAWAQEHGVGPQSAKIPKLPAADALLTEADALQSELPRAYRVIREQLELDRQKLAEQGKQEWAQKVKTADANAAEAAAAAERAKEEAVRAAWFGL